MLSVTYGYIMVAIAGRPKGPTPRTKNRPQRAKVMTQLLELQEHLHRDGTNTETSATARALVARAFLELERLKREIKMLPKPKAIDVVPKHRDKKPAFTEPIDAPRAAKNVAQENIAQAEQPSSETPTTNPPPPTDTAAS